MASISESSVQVGQDLQRHLPVQRGISGPIDLSHAALADESGDVVVSDAGADGEGHVLSG